MFGQTLPWWLLVKRGKDDREQNMLAPLIYIVHLVYTLLVD